MVIKLNESNFETEVLNYEGTIVIDMFAEWCGPCQIMSPLIDNLAEENIPNVKVCKVDIDEATELATRYGVTAIPTILVIKNGEVVNTFVGVTDIDEIKNVL